MESPNKVNILFLDMDGVLNSQQSTRMHWQASGRQTIWANERKMCPISCSNLQYLMEAVPNLNIVISSSWRRHHTLDEMRTILYMLAEIDWRRVIDMTPSLKSNELGHSQPRGLEIQAWLDENTKVPDGSPLMPKYQIDDFMILDDDSDMAHLKETNFLQTDSDLGFTIKDCRKLLFRFKKELPKPEDW